MDKLITILLIGLFSAYTFAADPTRPMLGAQKSTATESKTATQKSLTAIIKRKDFYLAVLDGKTYRQGDRYLNGRITRITRTSVMLSLPEGSKRLTLIPKIKSQ